MSEPATSALSLGLSRRRGDEDEEEEECVYVFRYPTGSLKVKGSHSHPESYATFLTVGPRVHEGVHGGHPGANHPGPIHMRRPLCRFVCEVL